MRDEDRLEILKKDLQMLTSSNDEYLEILLKQSKAAITREGIDLEIGIEGGYGCDTIRSLSLPKALWTGHFHAQVSAPPAE